MEQTTNTLDFVYEVMQRLKDADIATWLFGGWAEELWQLYPPRLHRDVDLLYPSSDFHKVDTWLATTHDVSLIHAKRFSHKRAFVYKQIMIEIFLLEPYTNGYITHFFDDRYYVIWPDNALTSIVGNGCTTLIAHSDMPNFYRQHHGKVNAAYRVYLAHQMK